MRKETILPFSTDTAALIQKGELAGEITFNAGTARLRVLTELGTGAVLVQIIDAPENTIPLESVKDSLVCHLYTDVPDVPRHLEKRLRFAFGGKTFVCAGSFRSNGIPKGFSDISRHIEYTDVPIVPDWDHAAFYAAVPQRQKTNDIFWCVEDGCYVCPGERCLFLFNL